MALTTHERAVLAGWLSELTGELDRLSRRMRVLTVTIGEDRPPPDPRPPTPDE